MGRKYLCKRLRKLSNDIADFRERVLLGVLLVLYVFALAAILFS